jgi:hypothetical protein
MAKFGDINTSGNAAANDVAYAPSGTISATTVQGAIEEVASEAGSGGIYNQAAGRVFIQTLATGYTGSTSGPVLTDFSVAGVSTISGRTYRFTLHTLVSISGAGTKWDISINGPGVPFMKIGTVSSPASTDFQGTVDLSFIFEETTTRNLSTYEIRVTRTAGGSSISFSGSATQPRFFSMEDIGGTTSSSANLLGITSLATSTVDQGPGAGAVTDTLTISPAFVAGKMYRIGVNASATITNSGYFYLTLLGIPGGAITMLYNNYGAAGTYTVSSSVLVTPGASSAPLTLTYQSPGTTTALGSATQPRQFYAERLDT